MHIYDKINGTKSKQFAILLDPDKFTDPAVVHAARLAGESMVDYIFIGGSLLTNDNIGHCIELLKEHCTIPIVIFPGSVLQIHQKADGILLLSLISGRNPDLLIGKQVIAAPYLKASGLEILPTGYMLIESGRITTAQFISNTLPIPHDKDDIAACTAMAGEMLGLKLIYLDAGSGADTPVSASMIGKVKRSICIPLIVGGGIRTTEQAVGSCKAGADIVVVGNAIEQDPSHIKEMAGAIHLL